MTNSSRPSLTSIAAACILSGGLITAAIIDSHRTAPVSVVGTTETRAMPPIAQDSARQQFEAQMNAQTPQPIREEGAEFTYKGVTVAEVDYSPKDDTLTFTYSPHWQSNTGIDSEILDASTTVTANSDGYGHYHGATNLGYTGSDMRDASFTIR